MKDSLKPGISETRHVEVDAERTIDFMGDDLRVYATPAVVSDMELTCRDLLVKHLDDGEDSVGARVEIDHMAPTLIGMGADIAVEVTKLDGRLATFEFTVTDDVEQVAKGRHVRFIVDIAKTADRLAAKREKAAGS